jgi:transcriptional regulator of arginine metabolism
MNAKRQRQQKLLELVSSRSLDRQEALVDALEAQGIRVTQSTLSKDLKACRIAKVPDGAGGFRYMAPSDGAGLTPGPDLLRRELEDFVVSVDGVELFVVVKTMTGHAQGVCESIDRAGLGTDVAGTIAGENTIFILCRSQSRRKALQKKLQQMTGAS